MPFVWFLKKDKKEKSTPLRNKYQDFSSIKFVYITHNNDETEYL